MRNRTEVIIAECPGGAKYERCILDDMKTLYNEPLAPYTSLRVGGPAETLMLPETYDEMVKLLQESATDRPWLIGFGCNVLISDQGLPGTTIMWRSGSVSIDDTLVTADAGVWWDSVVESAIKHDLWGMELMSEIPSSVGGAIQGNIAAYGQQVSDTLEWVEVFDTTSRRINRLAREDMSFSYRASSFQEQPHLVILRAGFRLSRTSMHELKYDAALMVADELGLDHATLAHCRDIIIETRRRAGSIYHPEGEYERTAGSFFKNPMVSTEQAEKLASFDETGKTLERIQNQSRIHGGDSHRASAAHVLLATGFNRGQTWGNVRLHPSHVLKVSTLPGATAQEVYDVVQEILSTVKTKLDIDLEPEVKFLGEFH